MSLRVSCRFKVMSCLKSTGFSADGNALAAKERLPLLLVNIQEQFTVIAREPLSLLSGDGSGKAHEKAASAI